MFPQRRAAFVLALLLAFPCELVAARGPWTPGWGFATGVPAQPQSLRSFYLNRSIVGYFVANNTGLASPQELAAETRLGIVGIGWNLDHLHTSRDPQSTSGSGGGLEHLEVQQATALKRARPDVKVMVLRNTQVVSIFWDAAKKAMQDPSLWLQSPIGSGTPIASQWGTDDPRSGTSTIKYYLNFSEPAARDWWLNEYVGPALDNPAIDGVYTDCSCGNPPGERITNSEAAGRQEALDAALALAASKGKWVSSWVNVGPEPLATENCDSMMRMALTIGSNENQTLQWLTANATVSKAMIAAFLIARGGSAVIALPPYDRPMLTTPFVVEDVDPNLDPGVPSGPAQSNGSRFWRSYSKAEVSLDCASMVGEVVLKAL